MRHRWKGCALTRSAFGIPQRSWQTTALPSISTSIGRVAKEVIAQQDGPVILVGHSCGGAVITEAGTDPKVASLVYVAAFAPDTGESVKGLLGDATRDNPPPIAPIAGGYFAIQRDKFHNAFAGDLSATDAGFLADSQLP